MNVLTHLCFVCGRYAVRDDLLRNDLKLNVGISIRYIHPECLRKSMRSAYYIGWSVGW